VPYVLSAADNGKVWLLAVQSLTLQGYVTGGSNRARLAQVLSCMEIVLFLLNATCN
jgi:hypothetical protein